MGLHNSPFYNSPYHEQVRIRVKIWRTTIMVDYHITGRLITTTGIMVHIQDHHVKGSKIANLATQLAKGLDYYQ